MSGQGHACHFLPENLWQVIRPFPSSIRRDHCELGAMQSSWATLGKPSATTDENSSFKYTFPELMISFYGLLMTGLFMS